jgi:hypothetical protein
MSPPETGGPLLNLARDQRAAAMRSASSCRIAAMMPQSVAASVLIPRMSQRALTFRHPLSMIPYDPTIRSGQPWSGGMAG